MEKTAGRWLPLNPGRDVVASFLVFLVAVPLGLGIALASGAPLVSGLVACAVGGILAGALAGAPLQISGPAAGLIILVYDMIQRFGWSPTLSAVVLAGGIQVGIGALGISRVCLAVTPAVVRGMLAGIGVVVALAQLQVMLGGSAQGSAWRNLLQLFSPGAAFDLHSALLGGTTLAILIGWQYLRAVRLVPGILVAIIAATLLGNFVWSDVKRVTLPDNFLAYEMPSLPTANMWWPLFLAAVALALVASVEALLCAVASDRMHDGPRAQLDKELVAQGVANTCSGLLGGLPITGVIVRTSDNIGAGATSRLSAVLHGVWVVLFVIFFGRYVSMIPLTALAALLVFVGFRLINRHHFQDLRTHREGIVYVATLAGVVLVGLMPGVIIGVLLSGVFLIARLAKSRIVMEERANRHWHVKVDGALAFFHVPALMSQLRSIPQGVDVDVNLGVEFMDHAAFEALNAWVVSHEKSGGRVNIQEAGESWYKNAAEGKPNVKSVKSTRLSLQGIFREKPAVHMGDLMRGVLQFRQSTFKVLGSVYEDVGSNGQHPQILFIACSDSRVTPDYITAARPGDLFVTRNIGNIVPPYDEASGGGTNDNSMAATLEFAVGNLGVPNIVVCGHSDCGAMKALLNPASISGCKGLEGWLSLGGTRCDCAGQIDGPTTEASFQEPHNRLSRAHVMQQLENLKTYPMLQERLAAGTLRLFGWYFDIRQAEVYVLGDHGTWAKIDEATTAVVPAE